MGDETNLHRGVFQGKIEHKGRSTLSVTQLVCAWRVERLLIVSTESGNTRERSPASYDNKLMVAREWQAWVQDVVQRQARDCGDSVTSERSVCRHKRTGPSEESAREKRKGPFSDKWVASCEVRVGSSRLTLAFSLRNCLSRLPLFATKKSNRPIRMGWLPDSA